jgi:hypothetical protein
MLIIPNYIDWCFKAVYMQYYGGLYFLLVPIWGRLTQMGEACQLSSKVGVNTVFSS